VARVIEAVDGERLALAAALGVDVPAFIDYFAAAGLTSEKARQTRSVYRAMQESAPNRTIRAPASLVHRYVDEDVGYGLVPMSELARLAGVPTPTMDALISLASTARCVDFRSAGLTLARMGLAGVSTSDLSRRVRD
jgi:opine dehydrogenase